MLGLHLSYPWLIASAALLGLANSVYHPADYAILSAHMDEARMGRAFSIHTFAGFLGGAVAPAIMATLVCNGRRPRRPDRGRRGGSCWWRCCLLSSAFPMRSAADRKVDGVHAADSKTSSRRPSSC